MQKNTDINDGLSAKNISSIVADYLLNEDWRSVEKFFNDSEFAQHFGIHVDLDNPEQPRCEVLDIKPFHLGGIGEEFVNGAVISALLDFSLGLTGLKYSKLGKFATSSLNIDIARPVEKGPFVVVAKTNQKIGKRVFSEATVFDSHGNPCVYATGVLRVGIKHG